MSPALVGGFLSTGPTRESKAHLVLNHSLNPYSTVPNPLQYTAVILNRFHWLLQEFVQVPWTFNQIQTWPSSGPSCSLDTCHQLPHHITNLHVSTPHLCISPAPLAQDSVPWGSAFRPSCAIRCTQASSSDWWVDAVISILKPSVHERHWILAVFSSSAFSSLKNFVPTSIHGPQA